MRDLFDALGDPIVIPGPRPKLLAEFWEWAKECRITAIMAKEPKPPSSETPESPSPKG